MSKLIVSGKTAKQKQRMAARGEIIRICHGLYLYREPHPLELSRILCNRDPQLCLTGKSAMEFYLRVKMTFPLHLAGTTARNVEPWFQVSRTRRLQGWGYADARVHMPLLAAENLDEDTAIEFVETYYGGRNGQSSYEHDCSFIANYSAKMKDLQSKIVLNSDSWAEKELYRALHKEGLKVLSNVKLGAYFWDLYLPKHKILIEVDGFEFHSKKLETFVQDRWKANDAVIAGYRVLRFSGSCIKHELAAVVQEILAAVKGTRPMPKQGVWLKHWIFHRGMPPEYFEYS
ncbi:endonuclease domain-containing protein [Corynebacterium camporealensis]